MRCRNLMITLMFAIGAAAASAFAILPPDNPEMDLPPSSIENAPPIPPAPQPVTPPLPQTIPPLNPTPNSPPFPKPVSDPKAEKIIDRLLGKSGSSPDPIAPIDSSHLTDEQVIDSIRRGVDFLITQIDPELQRLDREAERQKNARVRFFPDHGKQVGPLIMMTYALLHVGQQNDDPRLRFNSDTMRPLVTMLTDANIDFNYTASLQACALAQLPPKPEYKKALERVTAQLVEGMNRTGGYTYNLSDGGRTNGTFDNSNSQYGLLGVWTAADYGVETPNNYWRLTNTFWRGNQCRDGGWDYKRPGNNSTLTMTAAGVASLYVCQEYLPEPPRLEPKPDPVMDRGLANLISNFTANSNDLYYLYGVERVGLASGRKFFDKNDWYREAATHILTMQQPSGAFAGTFLGASEITNTCYAVLFLVRGRAPVVINKLQYKGPWNARPRDAANLASYFSKSFEKHLNWQIVSLDVAPEDWLDAPVLLITGSKDPNFTDADVEKIRQYIKAGGIVFSVADGGSVPFTEAMKMYAARIGGDQYEMRALPPDHPLFNVEVKLKNPPGVLGLSNGVRELWVHAPDDYGAAWEMRATAKTDAWDIATNMYFYASGRASLRSKLQTLAVAEPAEKPTQAITMARLEFPGNWDPEPGAWDRMVKIMDTKNKTDLQLSKIKIDQLNTGKEKGGTVIGVEKAPYNLAHLTGTGAFTLKDESVAELRKYVEGGGTLFIEAAGGNELFADSGKNLIKQLWPDAALETLPGDSDLYKAFAPQAAAITEVSFRKYWTMTFGGAVTPKLMGLKIKGRLAVIFSAEDISSGLLGTNTWGIGGYVPASSEPLARNILLWSARKQ